MIFNIMNARLRRINRVAKKTRKLQKLAEPHDWFAWYPVRVSPSKIVLFQTVTRQAILKESWHISIPKTRTKFYFWTYEIKSE